MEEDKELEHLTFYINEFYAAKNIIRRHGSSVTLTIGF